MRLTLNGLRIERVDDAMAASEDCDLLWRVCHVGALPAEPNSAESFLRIESAPSPAGPVTSHVFGHGGQMRCRFTIAPDGSEVVTETTPGVSDADVTGLFCEPVMRTILVRRGLISFHAAALERGGRGILLMGNKGAGKSTLSAALQQNGWTLMADDLVRIATVDQSWHCFPGHRLTKLMPDAALALGHSEGLPGRWESAAPDDHIDEGKVMIGPPCDSPPPLASVPIIALFVLSRREIELDRIRCVPATPVETVRALIANATPDPLAPKGAPPSLPATVISSLTIQAAVWRLTLPDRLADLRASAHAVAALAGA